MAKRTTKEQDEFEAREARLRANLDKQAARSIELRSKDREFHGLEREFRYHQAQMAVEFSMAGDVKHPRDVGSVREQILRKFLTASGFVPKRFAVSDRSIRVASPTGHLSNEIDIALYDYEDSISLMNREDIFEVLPVESVYGVIQVKSRLNREEIRNGLNNLASFKRLHRKGEGRDKIAVGAPKESRGFGILFAYDSDLSWNDLRQEIEDFSEKHPNTEWANAIFILNRGYLLHGTAEMGSAFNSHIERIEKLNIYSSPDRQTNSLYNFYDILLNLLHTTETFYPKWSEYYRLPLTSGSHSYRYYLEEYADTAQCDKHGAYARKIDPEKLEKVINWSYSATPINWIKAHHIAYGQPEDVSAYSRQPGDVRIYNPDNLPLPQILTREDTLNGQQIRSLSYDWIVSEDMNIWIPYCYSSSELIVSICPKCLADIRKRTQRSARSKRMKDQGNKIDSSKS